MFLCNSVSALFLNVVFFPPKVFILQLLISVFVQCCMSSFSNCVLQFTPQLEGSGWPCSSCGFSSLSVASRGHLDPQTSAASCSSTWPMRMCCSHSPRSAPSDCSQHQTPAEEKQKQSCVTIFWPVRFRKSTAAFLCGSNVVALGVLFTVTPSLQCMISSLCACAELGYTWDLYVCVCVCVWRAGCDSALTQQSEK